MTNAQKHEMVDLLVSAIQGSIADKAKYVRFVAEHCTDEERFVYLFLFFTLEVISESDDD